MKFIIIGKYEVTVGEFRHFVEATGYKTEGEKIGGCWSYKGGNWSQHKELNWRNPGFTQTERHPVVCVSWNDATAYAQWLSEQTGHSYRLPTEAEWEYAVRAGSETKYFFGNNEKQLSKYAWYQKNAKGKTHPVGKKLANAYGLHDILGNVWEWVYDQYGDYSVEEQINPQGPDTGFERVVRGGTWLHGAGYCRSANRYGVVSSASLYYLGFRLARTYP